MAEGGPAGAGADVIELGSSDDEPEPPKHQRPKPTKPRLNAMVSIPGATSPGLIIKRQVQIPGSSNRLKPYVKPQAMGMLKNPFANKNLKIQKNNKVDNGAPVTIQIVPNQPSLLKIKEAPAKVNVSHNVADIVKNLRAKFVQGIPIQPGTTKPQPGTTKSQPGTTKPQPGITKPQPSFKSVSMPGQPVKIAPHIKSPKLAKGPIVAKSLSQLQGAQLSKKPVQGQKCLTNLPPGITVTRTTGQPKRKRERRAVSPANVVIKKQKYDSTSGVLTVELDDDEAEPEPSSKGPEWYLRPGQENKPEEPETPDTSMELENNKEPEQIKEFVEITIEDSPIKPPMNKQTAKIAGQLPIIIEDSPKKPEARQENDKKDESLSSENAEVPNSPKSRKKLNYMTDCNEKIEIEVEFCTPVQIPIELSSPLGKKNVTLQEPIKQNKDQTEEKTQKDSIQPIKAKETEQQIKEKTSPTVDETSVDRSLIKSKESPNIVKVTEVASEIPESAKKIKTQDSPKAKERQSPNSDNSKKECSPKFIKSIKPPNSVVVQETKSKTSGLFSETYQEFIDVCFELENTDDMKKIVEKKVKEYYRQVDKSYTESEDFTVLVSDKIKAMRLNPENMYLYIKDIVDELKIRRRSAKEKPSTNELVKEIIDEAADESDGADTPNRNVRKLEKTLRKLHRAIQKLEEQEVDFDDDTDSVYLLTESTDGNSSQPKEKTPESDRQIQIKRYKARLVRVHAKLCQITGTKMPSESKLKLEARSGRPQGPTLKLEKWINRKVPAGAPLPFPDFHDVLRCVKEANDEDKLGWSEMEMKEEARDLFACCGKKLQKRRQENEWRIASSRISAEVDPAEASSELQQKLADNKKIAAKREGDLIDKYADRQKQLQLEPEEIEENDAEESAPSSDDDVQMIEEEWPSKSNKLSMSPTHQNREKDLPASPVKKTVATEQGAETFTNCELDNETVDVLPTNFNDNGIACAEVKCSDPESESEQLKLVLSDENSQNGSKVETKGSNSDGQSLLEKVYSINAVSTLESSDTDTPIAISDTHSSDNAQQSAKSSDVVSIENSSESEANAENPPKNMFCSPEKQFLLEIDCSEEENENIQSNIANDDAMSYENIQLGSTEDESNVIESNEEYGINSACQPDIVKSKDSTIDHEILLEDTKSGDESSVQETTSLSEENRELIDHNLNGVESESGQHCESFNLEFESGTSQPNGPLDNENLDKSEVPFNLDSENSNSRPLSLNENISNDQSSDVAMDIGPTVVEGGSVDTDNSNSEPTSLKEINQQANSQNLDLSMDIGPTCIEGANMDNENSNSRPLSPNENVSNDQSSDVAMDIGPTVVEGGSIDTDNSNSEPISLKEINQQPNSQNSDLSMDIGPTCIEGANMENENCNLDQNKSEDNLYLGTTISSPQVMSTIADAMYSQNSYFPLNIENSHSETTSSENNTNCSSDNHFNAQINTSSTVKKDNEDMTLSEPESARTNPAKDQLTPEPEVISDAADMRENLTAVNLQAECAMNIEPALVQNVEQEMTLAENNLIPSSKLDLNVALAGD